jgi:hypothetical protein
LDDARVNPGKGRRIHERQTARMAQFIALAERNTTDFTDADFAPLLEAEAERVRVMYAEGSVRQAYGRKDVLGAVVVLEAADLAAATALIWSLPFAQKGMLKINVFEVGPYRGFGPRG